MEVAPHVSVVLAPIARAFCTPGGREGCWAIAFRLVPPRGDIDRSVSAVRSALRTANRSVPPQSIMGLGAIRVGKKVLIPMYGDGVSIDVVGPWLQSLARELEKAGESGILQRTRSGGAYKVRPHVPLGQDRELSPIAFITYKHEDVAAVGDAVHDGWCVVPEVRQRLAEYAESWLQMRQGRAWFQRPDGISPIDRDQVGAALLAASSGLGGGIMYDAEEPWGQRSIFLWPGGQLVSSSWTVESVEDWQGWVEEVSAVLLVAPEHVQ